MNDKEFYAKVRAAIEALPEKRLTQGAYWSHTQNCPCAVGAYSISLGLDPVYEAGYGYAATKIKSPWLAWEATYKANDGYNGTPEERWAYMRDWLTRKIEEADG